MSDLSGSRRFRMARHLSNVAWVLVLLMFFVNDRLNITEVALLAGAFFLGPRPDSRSIDTGINEARQKNRESWSTYVASLRSAPTKTILNIGFRGLFGSWVVIIGLVIFAYLASFTLSLPFDSSISGWVFLLACLLVLANVWAWKRTSKLN